ncbi:MAG: oxalate/formate MFS antiporter, partial [Cupriavidus sp.]|nr:oxalate/formate MFS antiporter [Cupriavidus sp.]
MAHIDAARPAMGNANGGWLRNRWFQLFIGVLCMGLVANLQYGWTLFVTPMNAKHHWGDSAIQVAFSIFIVTETWLVPL